MSTGDKKLRACLGVSGSVAAVKVGELVESLLGGLFSNVDVVVTGAGKKFWDAEYKGAKVGEGAWRAKEGVTIYDDETEWGNYKKVGEDAVLHVDIAKRCDLLLIAPMCANTLASAALGISNNLLTCVIRAWPYDLIDSSTRTEKPIILAPAMNTVMWEQRITHTHLKTLRKAGAFIIDPVVKELACGDTGIGAMAEVATVVEKVNGIAGLDRSGLIKARLGWTSPNSEEAGSNGSVCGSEHTSDPEDPIPSKGRGRGRGSNASDGDSASGSSSSGAPRGGRGGGRGRGSDTESAETDSDDEDVPRGAHGGRGRGGGSGGYSGGNSGEDPPTEDAKASVTSGDSRPKVGKGGKGKK